MRRLLSLRTLILISALLAFGLRIYRLDCQPLRGDESFSIQFSAHQLDWLLPSIATVEPNPPLYYLLLHYWMQLLGQSEFVTRFLSLLFGVLSVPLIYQLGKSMGRPYVGGLAALLLAINPFQIWHAQDVRNYTLWPALSIAALTFLLRALREGRPRQWMGYASMTLLSLFTHYYDLFLLLFQNLFFFAFALGQWRREEQPRVSLRRVLCTWIVIQVSLALVFGPWLMYGSSRLVAITEGDSPPLWTVFSRCLTAFSIGETVSPMLRTAALPFLVLLVVYGLARTFSSSRYHALFLILYIVAPSVCVFGAAQVRPLFRERYLNAIAPAYYLSFAWGLLSPAEYLRRWKAVPLVAGVTFLGLFAAHSLNNHYHNPQYQKSPDWRALSVYLASETEPGDVLILNYPDPTFSYYYDGRAPSFILPRGLLSQQVKIETADALRVLATKYERIWFYPLTDVGWDNEGFVENWLNRHASLVAERDILGFRWLIYQPVVVSLNEVQYPLHLTLGDSILLRGYDCDACADEPLGRASINPGTALHVTLYWEAMNRVDTAYSVFVHLIDASGRIYVQRDAPPRGGDFPTNEWMSGDIIVDPYSLLVPSDAPPGDYGLIVGMYDPATAQRLPVADDTGAYQGDHVTIAKFTVE